LPCHPGLYAPGSTFKILVTAAAVEKGLESKVFDDNGSVVIDGREIRNSESRAYGKIDLKRALAVSSMCVRPAGDGAWHGKLCGYNIPCRI